MDEKRCADIDRIIAECGFDDCGQCAAADLRTCADVRDMCASGRCGCYGRSWSCPPGCGSLEEYQERISAYECCSVVQTVCTLEDDFDFETMMAAENVHKQRVAALSSAVREQGIDALVLASGSCTLCPTCTYPDAPCRFPERRLVSMEAAGLMVSDVCNAGGVPYNHGRGTIAYTSCILV